MKKVKIIKSFRKTLSLQVKNWEIILKSPFFVLSKTINDFLDKNKAWIEKQISKYSDKKFKTENEILNLKKKAKSYIPDRVEYLASKYGFKYNKIKITSAKTRWWSCTSQKNLNFTFYLMWAPKEVIDYVIIHELSHLKEMNHSKKFWDIVYSMMPDYKIHIKWLNTNWYKLF